MVTFWSSTIRIEQRKSEPIDRIKESQKLASLNSQTTPVPSQHVSQEIPKQTKNWAYVDHPQRIPPQKKDREKVTSHHRSGGGKKNKNEKI